MMNSRDVARLLLKKKDRTARRYWKTYKLSDNDPLVKLGIDRKEDRNSIPFYATLNSK